jgi:hypothetical protein
MALSDPKKNTKPKIKAVINKLADIVKRHQTNKHGTSRRNKRKEKRNKY